MRALILQSQTHIAFLLLFLVTTSASSDVYRWRDDRGLLHFADRPAPGAEVVEVKVPSPKPNAADTYLRVAHVYDGDTLKLNNGEKVRLLGINTPEIGAGRKPEEAGGRSALHWLRQTLHGRLIRLESDSETHDHYHRRLAHVFTEDGTHINLALVEQGYATTDIYPPNLKYVDDLVAAEAKALSEHRGLWALPQYQRKTLEHLNTSELSGWQRLVGKVLDVRKSHRYFRLRFEGGFEVHIPKMHAQLFPPVEHYVGRSLELRGWVSHRLEDSSMVIRHPSALIQH